MERTAFGKYTLLKKVGSGGMAELFLARQSGIEGFEKLIVLKTILPHLVDSMASEEFVKMFLDEARLAARLNHPNIVQIYELGKFEDRYFIAMEYVDGVDLRRMLRKGERLTLPIPIPHAIKICSLVCEALTYAHNLTDGSGNHLGIVHRDISPHNVLVSFDGGVKLTDFGIAKATSHQVKTKAGTLKGKLNYVSPEQIAGHKPDHRSDLFAVGILLYEMTAGCRPFHGQTEFEILEAIVYQEPQPPTEFISTYPPALVPIIQRALAKDPDQRYADALSLQLDLDHFLMEQKSVSNSSLIGQYVRSLFESIVAAKTGIPKNSVSPVEQTLSGAALAHLPDMTPSEVANRSQRLEQELNEPALEFDSSISDVFKSFHAEVTKSGKGRKPPGVHTESLSKIDVQSAESADGAGDLEQADAWNQQSPVSEQIATGQRDPAEVTEPVSLPDSGQPVKKPFVAYAIAALVVVVALVAGGVWMRINQSGSKDPKSTKITLLKQEPHRGTKQADGQIDAGRAKATKSVSSSVDSGATRSDAAKVPKDAAETEAVDAQRSRKIRIKHPPVHKKNGDTRVTKKAREGFLTIDSQPWSEVWLGKKRLGLTPLSSIKLPVGRHKLRLENPKAKLSKSAVVKIRANKTTLLKVHLTK